ncbi:MAG: hypothetical protein ACI85O_001223 [Saprospiraceae bacterium]|jgi:hypothetical protein
MVDRPNSSDYSFIKRNILVMKKTTTQILSLVVLCFGLQSMSAQEQILTINAPADITAILEMGEGAAPEWPGALGIGEMVTGDLAYVEALVDPDDDNVDDTPVMGCVELGNPDDILGKIALVQRGSCSFSAKVDAAQNAGAIAVVICNNRPLSEDGGGIVNLLATDPWAGTDTIPVGFLSQEDCASIRMALDNGENVNVTIGVKEFVDASAANTYETPVKNIVPLMGLGATIFVQENTPVTITWEVTDPNGVMTTLTTTEDATAGAANGNTFSVDEPYIPEAVGTYTVLVSNDVNEEILNTEFIITEDTDVFALDNGVIDGDVTIASGDAWTMPAAGDGNIFDANIVIRAGMTSVEIQTVEFGLSNWAEMLTDAEGPVEFTFQIFDMDPELDGTLVDFPAGGSDYSVFENTPVAFNIYTVTADEVDGETTTVSLDAFGNGTYPIVPSGGAYLVSMQYRGQSANNGIPPAYLTAGNTCYLDAWDGSIITSQWFSGFVGCPNIVMRTTAPEWVSSVENTLSESAVIVTPNPVSTQLNVAIDLKNTSEEIKVQVINVNGAIMVNETMDNVLSTNLTFDVAKYPAGTYFIQVVTQEGFTVEKFVKH